MGSTPPREFSSGIFHINEATGIAMQLDAFMCLKTSAGDLKGEGTDELFPDQIEILSFDQTILRTDKGKVSKSGTADIDGGKYQFKPITIIKLLDQTSPKLYAALCNGTTFTEVTLNLCQPSGTSKDNSDRWTKKPYLIITLSAAILTRVHLAGDPSRHYFGGEGALYPPSGSMMGMGPLEEIEFSPGKIKWEYKGGSGNLNINANWNMRTNT